MDPPVSADFTQYVDWPTISGYHSQLTGVLAGFAFAALTLLISNPPDGKTARDISDPLYTLLAVFFSMIISSVLYALATGVKSNTGPAYANMFASVVFAVAAVQLFGCLSWFFREYRLAPEVVEGAHALCEGATLIGAVMTATTIGNWLNTVMGSPYDYQKDASSLGWVLPALLFPLLGTIVRRVRHKKGLGLMESDRLRKLMRWELRFVIAVAVYCGLIIQTHPTKRDNLFPPAMKHVLTISVGLLMYQTHLVLPDSGRPKKKDEEEA